MDKQSIEDGGYIQSHVNQIYRGQWRMPSIILGNTLYFSGKLCFLCDICDPYGRMKITEDFIFFFAINYRGTARL
jgi:hypothetical protein